MSAAWMAGYVSDVAYTLGFYRELAPAFLNYVCLANGVEGLKEGRKLRYCELGCGRGYGTALLAAANPDIEFVAVDFNPAHITEARTLAADCRITNVRFIEASFADATRDPGLGEFDIVALHGVYTWVDRAVRRDIVDFIRMKLVPGGIAFASYNTLPGWAVVTPIQHFLKEYGSRSTGNSVERLDKGRIALEQLAKANAGFVSQNPSVKARIEGLAGQDKNYLAHEFLNLAWEPIYVTDALRDFAEAKLTYIGSANTTENRNVFCVPQEMAPMVNSAPDLPLREQLKDYAVNKQFRRDVYVKGPIRLTPVQFRQRWNKLSFHRSSVATEFPEVWRIPAGEARIKPELIKAVIDSFDKGNATGAEIFASVTDAKFSDDEALSVLELFVAAGHMIPSRPDHASIDRAPSRRLNKVVLDQVLVDDTHRFLAAPAIGSAIGANYLERLVLPLLAEDASADSAKIMDRAFTVMEKHDRHMTRDGKPITREQTDDMAKLVAEIQKTAMPLWRSLGVVD